jgi:hypothetical protein
MPQLSLLLAAFKICAAVILAVLPLKLTAIFWQTTVGAVASLTVTTAVQVAVLPCPSLAVSVTVFAPKLLQVKTLGDKD